MIERVWFKPTEDMRIIDPATRTIVPPEGKWIAAHDPYFQRRVADGGGAIVDPPHGADA